MVHATYWNEELETRPWQDVQEWQAGRIERMLASVRARSAMYAEQYANLPADLRIRAFADLQRLPFTLKDHLRAAQDAATDAQPFGANQCAPLEDIVQTLCSSGTTGRPLYYAMTRGDLEMFTDAIAHTWHTAGIGRRDVVAHLVGLPMVAGGLPYADGFRRVGATLCWLGGFPTDRILREMRQLRVTAVLATTSFALHLAEQWRHEGVAQGIPSRLAKVLCGGEPGLNQPMVRERVQQGLGITHLRETMGLGDVLPSMWAECEAQDGMHFNVQRYVAIELIDPDSGAVLPWRDGAAGEIVYTAFEREATPLLRYRSRDHAVVTGMKCACGRTSPRIRCIGRTDDMLIYKGMNVFPTAIRDLVTSRFAGQVEPILQAWREHPGQVRFDEPIAVDVETVAGFDPAQVAALARNIEAEVRTQLQVRVAVTVLPFGSLPRGTYKNAILAIRTPTA
jgi:phenylacetate-CoA ligase/benzoylacetate-CoA ligase